MKANVSITVLAIFDSFSNLDVCHVSACTFYCYHSTSAQPNGTLNKEMCNKTRKAGQEKRQLCFVERNWVLMEAAEKTSWILAANILLENSLNNIKILCLLLDHFMECSLKLAVFRIRIRNFLGLPDINKTTWKKKLRKKRAGSGSVIQ